MIIVALFVALIVLVFLGYVFHIVFHKSWSGHFYRAHMNHHLKQYPPEDYVSDVYRDAGKDNTIYLFAFAFFPLVFLDIVLIIFGALSIVFGVGVLVEMIVISWLNSEMHDAFHTTKTFWHRFWFFERLKKLHYMHHVDMTKNYGIFSFTWDKIFGTFKDI